MKTVLSFITIAAVITACNSNPKMGAENVQSNGAVVFVKDTTGLADFQAWKAYEADVNYSATTKRQAAAVRPARKASPISRTNRSVSNTKSETLSTEAAYPAKAPAKKGWSKAAKGAAIGGVTGAAAGAVINKKNRVVGGVVGGVLGAGAGYGIGRTMDKKDGRYLVSH